MNVQTSKQLRIQGEPESVRAKKVLKMIVLNLNVRCLGADPNKRCIKCLEVKQKEIVVLKRDLQ